MTVPTMIFVRAAECPKCGSDDLQTRRSTADSSDGARTVTRNTRCRACGWLFSVVVEHGPDFRQDLAGVDWDALQRPGMETPELTSIGMLATRFSRTVDECRKVQTAIGVRPVMRLNGIDHFDSTQVAQFAEAFGDASTHGPATRMTAVEIEATNALRSRQFDDYRRN